METIKDQYNAMLDRGIIAVFEFSIVSDEYLLVELDISDQGILFSFDSDNKRVAFDGEIVTIDDNHYCLPFDKYNESLDSYLEVIHENITEGYLIPNNLYK